MANACATGWRPGTAAPGPSSTGWTARRRNPAHAPPRALPRRSTLSSRRAFRTKRVAERAGKPAIKASPRSSVGQEAAGNAPAAGHGQSSASDFKKRPRGLMALRNLEGRTKEAHHLGKRQISFALEGRTAVEVAHEGVFGRIHALLEPHARDLQSLSIRARAGGGMYGSRCPTNSSRPAISPAFSVIRHPRRYQACRHGRPWDRKHTVTFTCGLRAARKAR